MDQAKALKFIGWGGGRKLKGAKPLNTGERKLKGPKLKGAKIEGRRILKGLRYFDYCSLTGVDSGSLKVTGLLFVHGFYYDEFTI